MRSLFDACSRVSSGVYGHLASANGPCMPLFDGYEACGIVSGPKDGPFSTGNMSEGRVESSLVDVEKVLPGQRCCNTSLVVALDLPEAFLL